MTSPFTQSLLNALDTGQPMAAPTPDTRSWIERLDDTLRPAEHQNAWNEFQQNMRASNIQLQRELDDAALAERGRSIVASAAFSGLPVPLVNRAISAVAAEAAASLAHKERRAAADAYVAKHGLQPPASSTHIVLYCAEAATEAAEATVAATRVCLELGRVAGQVAQARAVLGSETSRRAEVERAAQAAHADITADVEQARAVLASVGL